MLKNTPNKLFLVPVKDKIPKKRSISDISMVQNWKQSETSGLVTLLELKVNKIVMITWNIDTFDRNAKLLSTQRQMDRKYQLYI